MAALPHIKREGRGSLIHVSSVEARRSFLYHSAYGASKHGIDGFLEAMLLELIHEGLSGINVTNVMPALINTPLFNKCRTKIGVKPQGLPPIYQPDIVVDAILYAACHPTRNIIAGGAGRAMDLIERLSPQLMDTLFLQAGAGFKLQETSEPKSEDAPDNLFGPIAGFDLVEGDFSKQSRANSYSTWLETHPTAKWGAIAVAVLGSPNLGYARE
jgi:hypothetical protein